MAENMFGVSRLKLNKKDTAGLEAIAKKHGAWLVEANVPGTGYQRWFASRDQGWLLNKPVEDAVYADIDRSGIKAWL